jgi:hypothetical protein
LEAREARGKRVAELIQKEIALANAAPKERVAGLVDVVDESEDLCYIDDDTTQVAKSSDAPLPQPQCDSVVAAVNLGEGLGAKAQDPIDLDAPEAGESAALVSRSPPPASGDFDLVAAKPADIIAPEPTTTPETLQPEYAGMMFLLRDGFCVLPMNHALRLLKPLVFVLILAAKTLVTLSVKDREKDTPQTEMDPSASGQVSHLCWESLV